MDALKNGWIILFTSHHSQCGLRPKTFLQIVLAAKWLVRHSRRPPPQPASTTFAFPSKFILLLCCQDSGSIERETKFSGLCLKFWSYCILLYNVQYAAELHALQQPAHPHHLVQEGPDLPHLQVDRTVLRNYR